MLRLNAGNSGRFVWLHGLTAAVHTESQQTALAGGVVELLDLVAR